MERLTKRKYGGIVPERKEKEGISCSNFCNNCSQGTGNCKYLKQMIEKLATYEDAEEQGLLPPCDVGDIVYRINKGARQPVIALVVTEIRHKALRNGNVALKIICSDDVMTKTNGSLVYYEEEIGKKIFLTKSEAEQALARMEGGNEM